MSHQPCVIDHVHLARRIPWMRVLQMCCDPDVSEEATQHEELIEAEVGRVDYCVSDCLEVILECPWIIRRTTHGELTCSKGQNPDEAEHSEEVEHLEILLVRED